MVTLSRFALFTDSRDKYFILVLINLFRQCCEKKKIGIASSLEAIITKSDSLLNFSTKTLKLHFFGVKNHNVFLYKFCFAIWFVLEAWRKRYSLSGNCVLADTNHTRWVSTKKTPWKGPFCISEQSHSNSWQLKWNQISAQEIGLRKYGRAVLGAD